MLPILEPIQTLLFGIEYANSKIDLIYNNLKTMDIGKAKEVIKGTTEKVQGLFTKAKEVDGIIVQYIGGSDGEDENLKKCLVGESSIEFMESLKAVEERITKMNMATNVEVEQLSSTLVDFDTKMVILAGKASNAFKFLELQV